jgi:hypothetical protein
VEWLTQALTAQGTLKRAALEGFRAASFISTNTPKIQEMKNFTSPEIVAEFFTGTLQTKIHVPCIDRERFVHKWKKSN